MLVWIVFAAPLLLLLLGLLFLHPHFFHDVRHVRQKLKVRRRIAEHHQTNHLILDRFLEVVDLQPHKPFIRFIDETYTYRDADELSSKAARVFLQSGRIGQGDVVALLLTNKPVFLLLWLALLKVGCSAAFLNSNVRSKSLLHCFSRCGAKTLVTDEGIHRDSGVSTTLAIGQTHTGKHGSTGVQNEQNPVWEESPLDTFLLIQQCC